MCTGTGSARTDLDVCALASVALLVGRPPSSYAPIHPHVVWMGCRGTGDGECILRPSHRSSRKGGQALQGAFSPRHPRARAGPVSGLVEPARGDCAGQAGEKPCTRGGPTQQARRASPPKRFPAGGAPPARWPRAAHGAVSAGRWCQARGGAASIFAADGREGGARSGRMAATLAPVRASDGSRVGVPRGRFMCVGVGVPCQCVWRKGRQGAVARRSARKRGWRRGRHPPVRGCTSSARLAYRHRHGKGGSAARSRAWQWTRIAATSARPLPVHTPI